jgi:hypothetical protein
MPPPSPSSRMSRIFRSSSTSEHSVGSLDPDAKLITVPKGWTAQTGALLLPDVVIGKVLGEGFQARLLPAKSARSPSPGPDSYSLLTPPLVSGHHDTSEAWSVGTVTSSSKRCAWPGCLVLTHTWWYAGQGVRADES